jgi:hypothetical protein
MASQQPVDVVVVSPELREPDILPMAEFIHRSFPATGVIVLSYDAIPDASVSPLGVNALMTV